MAQDQNHLIWLDMEMTGREPDRGRILEIAVVITDPQLNTVAEGPVILVDLVLNWMTPKNETLRVIRMRGDQFDPRRVLAEQSSPTEALRVFVKTVLDRSHAIALPDPEDALGQPFSSFEEIAIYQRAVLLVEGPAK